MPLTVIFALDIKFLPNLPSKEKETRGAALFSAKKGLANCS